MIGTYWEHRIGHMNAEQGSETVKSSLSLAVPSSDCASKEQNAGCVIRSLNGGITWHNKLLNIHHL